MCGIAGTVHPAEPAWPVDRDALDRMDRAMAVRGPDGHAIWTGPGVGLGHRRLSLIDLSEAGSQPMASADGRYRIVYNGEIYNYDALRRELLAAGQEFRSHSDTEVLLALYARHGAAMLPRLRGMFAFAVWDAERRTLFAARDGFGIKPFYYAWDGAVLRFASTVRTLRAAGGIPDDPDPAGHVGFFLLGSVPEPHTLYRAIRALPAGHHLTAGPAGLAVARWFDLGDELRAARDAPGRGDDLRQALLDSVRHHLVADVPVGVFLSAGRDSTTLTALAAELEQGAGRGELHSVTLGYSEYEGDPRDEVPLAELVARHYGTVHRTRRVPGEEFAAALPALLEQMDQPTIDGVNVWFVSRAVAAEGLKAALSGLGADELFGGYDTFQRVPRVARLPRLGPLGPLLRLASAGLLRRLDKPKHAGLLEYGGSFGRAWLVNRALHMPWELDGVLPREMVRAGLDELDLLERLERTAAEVADGDDDFAPVSALELGWYMRNQLLRDADWAGMAHGLEIRVPFVDLPLVRAVWRLRARAQADGASPPDKAAMAATPARPLPDEVRNKAKTGFGIPVREWLLGSGRADAAQRGLRGWAGLVYRHHAQL